MSHLFRSDFFRFAGGFALGLVALVAAQGDARAALAAKVEAVAHRV